MEIRDAQAFIVVAEELNFGRAAKRLHMAQPPLSRLIRNMESDLGAVLFERNTRRVSLTPQGEALLGPARELVMSAQRMREIAKRSQAGEVGRIRLGFGEAAVNRAVLEIAQHFRRNLPGIALELFNSQFAPLGFDKLNDGRLDLFIGRADFLPGELDSRIIAREQLLIAMPEDHPLAKQEAVSLADMADEPWVVLPGGDASLSRRLYGLAVDGGFVPRVVQVAPDSPTLLLLVGAGYGLALTLSSVRDAIPARGIVYKPVNPDQDPVEVRLSWRRDNRNPALETALRVCAELFPG